MYACVRVCVFMILWAVTGMEASARVWVGGWVGVCVCVCACVYLCVCVCGRVGGWVGHFVRDPICALPVHIFRI